MHFYHIFQLYLWKHPVINISSHPAIELSLHRQFSFEDISVTDIGSKP